MARSNLIIAALLLTGVGIVNPIWVSAQESEANVVEIPVDEAAPPADPGDHGAFQFFPRATMDEGGADAFMATEAALSDGVEQYDSLNVEGGELTPWEATERFSRRNFSETIPVQYPLDDSAYEGEAPTGDDAEGDWRGSSVHRPDMDLPSGDQPWVKWHKVTIQAQTLPAGSDGLGITSLDLRGTLKFSRVPFVFVTPRAGVHFLDGSPATDLPDRLYDFSVDTTVFLPLNDRWTMQAAVTPSLYSDLTVTKNAFRMVGRGLVFYRWSPQLQLAGGFVYLGRKDIVALPAAGFVYTPSDDVKIDFMFPKPRAGYRYQHNEERERWVYVTGELGGGSWAIERSSGAEDVATYRDLQLLLGIEHKQQEALNWQIEAGYVFSRKLEYQSELGDTELPSSAVFRVVLSF